MKGKGFDDEIEKEPGKGKSFLDVGMIFIDDLDPNAAKSFKGGRRTVRKVIKHKTEVIVEKTTARRLIGKTSNTRQNRQHREKGFTSRSFSR